MAPPTTKMDTSRVDIIQSLPRTPPPGVENAARIAASTDSNASNQDSDHESPLAVVAESDSAVALLLCLASERLQSQASPAALRQKLVSFSQGELRPQHFGGPLVHRSFEGIAAAEAHCNQACLVNDGGSMSYGQVDAAASVLARRLVGHGVGRDVAVGILLERSFGVVVAVLAVLKAGACYLPLDPSFPADRLAIYLEDSGAAAVITQPEHTATAVRMAEAVPGARPLLVLLDDEADSAAAANVALPAPANDSEESLAYIMFTSGSTGRPKGAMITHRGLRDLIGFFVEKMELGPADVFCLNTTICFDPYVLYVYSCLAVGGRLLVPHPDAHLDPEYMADAAGRHGVTILEVVPSLAAEYLRSFGAAAAGRRLSIRRFLTGGEALTPQLAGAIGAALPALTAGGPYNTYGPTEVTVQVTTGQCLPPFERITLGRPDHNVHTYIVAPGSQPPRLCAVGEPGELLLSGPRLARGYMGRPDLTAAAFVPNAFVEEMTAGLPKGLRRHYQLCYRTGDLVRWGTDGCIEFLGRIDCQVKINGVRIEVTEVESVLAGAPGVSHAAVKAWTDPRSGEYKLVGYINPETADTAAALAHCRDNLLAAMVPTVVLALPRLARLPSGKTDQKSLPEPEWAPSLRTGAGLVERPASDTERLLLGIWEEVLGVEEGKVGATADFFEVGGTSLRAELVNSAVRRSTGADISGLLIYQHRTVRGMASALDEAAAERKADRLVADVELVMGYGGEKGEGAAPQPSQLRRGLPMWAATLLQFLGLVFAHMAEWIVLVVPAIILIVIYDYTPASEVQMLVVVPAAFVLSHLFLLALALVAKWALLGRQRPCEAPLWGWLYVRWWTVRALQRNVATNVFPFIRSTQMLNWYLRAMGARIGRRVVVDTQEVGDWDLLEIGDDTVIESNALLFCADAHAGTSPQDRGRIVFRPIKIGRDCTVGCQTVISPGTDLPDASVVVPGTATSNPTPTTPLPADTVRTEPGPLPLPLTMLASLLLLWVHSLMWLAEVVGPLVVWYALNDDLEFWQVLDRTWMCWTNQHGAITGACTHLWWTELVALSILPVTMWLVGNLYLALLVPLKWALVGRMTPEKCVREDLWWRFRSHLWRSLLELPIAKNVYAWTATEVFNCWLRALGTRVGRQAWLSEKLRNVECDLFEVGDHVSICSNVAVVCATVGSAARVRLHANCDVTNESVLSPGATVESHAVLGVFTFGRPGQTFGAHSITQGKAVLHPGYDLESGAAPQMASRAVTAWQYVRYNLLYSAATCVLIPLTNLFTMLPEPYIVLTGLYFGGIWLSLALMPLAVGFGMAVAICYAAAMKRLLLPDSKGGHPIFLSYCAGAWQQLCIMAYFYDDFYSLMGSQFYVWFLRAMGARVGRDVCCLGGYSSELDQLTIGDGAVLNECAFFMAHTVEHRCVKIRPITIGVRATVGALTGVLPDSTLEEGSAVGDLSVVMKGETVPAGAYWAGVPAVPVQRLRAALKRKSIKLEATAARE